MNFITKSLELNSFSRIELNSIMMMQILPIISDDKVTSSHLLFTFDASHKYCERYQHRCKNKNQLTHLT